MIMEPNKTIVYDHILVRYGELSTKGKNKKDFIKRLLTNVKNALRDFEKLSYERTHDRLYILLNGEDAQFLFLCDSYSVRYYIDDRNRITGSEKCRGNYV